MSLRTRLFGTYALVVIICLAVVAIALTALLQGYRDRLAMDRLDNIARPVSVQIRSLASSQTSGERLASNLQEQAERNGVYVLLVNKDDAIVRQMLPDKSLEPLIPNPRTFPGDVAEAAQGRFTTTDHRIFIYAAYPVGKLPAALAGTTETVILAAPRARSLAILAGLFVPIAVAGVIALFVSLIVAIVFARSVYGPIKQLKRAAGGVARGDYAHRIPVAGPVEMRDLAASFNHMTDEVRRSQEQLRHFVADVSHELKSPLTSIEGFSQALVDGTAADDETRSKAAGIVNSEAKRMRRQVDELLELSRMQSGQFKMAREPVDLSDVIARCHDVFDMQAREKGIRLIRRTAGALAISGDADRLEQLFTNLLDNAVKNTPGGGQVTITGAEAGGFIEITVADNGPGIPAEHLPHVFERFYQVTGVRTGVGLGLAIASEIASAHGGTIQARSHPGVGAEFVVRLPASKAGPSP